MLTAERPVDEKSAPINRRRFCAASLAALLSACSLEGRNPGAIAIGSSPTGVPFSFVDPWSNELAGAMVDVARDVARLLGKQPDFRITPFAALIPSLTVAKIDLVAAAIVRTPEREQVVDFSDPIFDYSGGLVVRDDIPGPFPDLKSLGRLRVGAQVGTRYVDQLMEAGVGQVTTYDSLTDVLRDMAFGRIDAGFGDGPLLAYQLMVGPKRPARIVKEFRPPVREQLCLLVQKHSPLLPAINRAIAQLGRNRITAITRHWGIE